MEKSILELVRCLFQFLHQFLQKVEVSQFEVEDYQGTSRSLHRFFISSKELPAADVE